MRAIIILLLLAGACLLPRDAAAAGICDCCDCTNCVMTFYFHGNLRCDTCRTIERYTKETIETYFKDELRANELCFEVINTDEKENAHFTKDYQLYTRSVVLALVKDGREKKFTNLVRIWELTRDKEKFQRYVADEITHYLQEL